MKHISLLAAALLAATLFSCENSDIEPVAGPMPLVVEGWIEEGEAPVVIVTRAVDLTQPAASFDGFVEKWGRVSIFDGDKRYILTGRKNDDYMPSFIFTASRLKGKAGHTYRLLIETETDTAEAVATLLPSPSLKPLKVVPVEGPDTLFMVRAEVDGIDSDGYYKFFARSELTESRFYASFMGTFAGCDYDPEAGYYITRGVHSSFSDEELGHYYKAGDRVTVKLCSLEPRLYDFWRVYDSNVSLSQNLFFTFAENCPGNVTGALGYWAAYGTSSRSVRIK